MHRPDREVKDIDEIINFVKEEKVCRIGLLDDEGVYIVPMNYCFSKGEGKEITFYLHCARVGKKVDILKKNPSLGLEIDGHHEIYEGEISCQYGMYYMSLIGKGKAEFIEDYDEKVKALSLLMLHQTGKEMNNFGEKWVNAVCIFKVVLKDYTVKAHHSPV